MTAIQPETTLAARERWVAQDRDIAGEDGKWITDFMREPRRKPPHRRQTLRAHQPIASGSN